MHRVNVHAVIWTVFLGATLARICCGGDPRCTAGRGGALEGCALLPLPSVQPWRLPVEYSGDLTLREPKGE